LISGEFRKRSGRRKDLDQASHYSTEIAAENAVASPNLIQTPQRLKRKTTMDLYVIRRASAWANMEELKAAGAKSARIGTDEMSDRVRWIRTYVVNEADGRIGTFCIYEARDGESIREHARRVGMPGDEFYPVETTFVVRSDPADAKAA
jgi:hypothetical protein